MGHRGQEPNESTDDAVWQDLVARLEGTPGGSSGSSSGTAAPPPSDGRTPPSALSDGDTDSRPDPTDRERAEAVFRNQPFSAAGPRDYSTPEVPEDAEEHEGFVPDEPPPLGSADPLTVLAWVGAAGGPIALLLVTMFWRNAPLGAVLGLLVVFLAGAGYLVTKLPKHRDLEDDGAEV
jgi:hypothetical protein